MVHANLGGDALLGAMRGREQIHLDRRRQVQDVQQGIVPTCQVDRQLRRRQAGFRRANLRMLRHRHVFAIGVPRPRLVLPDGRRVLAVGHDHDRSVCKDVLQHPGIVDEHVARGGAHEYLDAAGVAYP